jgi:hypothetical protein
VGRRTTSTRSCGAHRRSHDLATFTLEPDGDQVKLTVAALRAQQHRRRDGSGGWPRVVGAPKTLLEAGARKAGSQEAVDDAA